jgi:hypothetical protein
MTLRSAVFASPSCVEWAAASGLELNGTPPLVWQRHRVAGKASTVAALVAGKKAGLVIGYHLMQGVVASGSVSKLRWLLDEQHAVLPQTLCDYAAVSGSVEALSWLRARGRVFTADAARVAAEAGHTNVLHFLKLNGYPFDVRATAAAAVRGDVAVLRWLHEHGCPWRDKELCHVAAATNRAQILQYVLSEAPGVLSLDLMLVAVERGSLDACRLLLQEGCPLHADCCDIAVEYWHVATFRWLLQEGCPCRVEAIWQDAAQTGNSCYAAIIY